MALLLEVYFKTTHVMKFMKYILYSFVIAFSFLQCKSAAHLANNHSPILFGSVYYKDSVSSTFNIKEGFNIYIPMASNAHYITLDSIYFKGRLSKLSKINDTLYTGFIKNENTRKPDIVMSSNPLEEYGNAVPKIPEKQGFQLKENACMVSYKDEQTIKWIKIENMSFKPLF